MSAVPVMSSVHLAMMCAHPVTQIWQKSQQDILESAWNTEIILR